MHADDNNDRLPVTEFDPERKPGSLPWESYELFEKSNADGPVPPSAKGHAYANSSDAAAIFHPRSVNQSRSREKQIYQLYSVARLFFDFMRRISLTVAIAGYLIFVSWALLPALTPHSQMLIGEWLCVH